MELLSHFIRRRAETKSSINSMLWRVDEVTFSKPTEVWDLGVKSLRAVAQTPDLKI
jgi:hypothetical protein